MNLGELKGQELYWTAFNLLKGVEGTDWSYYPDWGAVSEEDNKLCWSYRLGMRIN